MSQATLSEYIQFLRSNGFHQEAQFYQNEVPRILKLFGFNNVYGMSTAEILARLYEIQDGLLGKLKELEKSHTPRRKEWDVECRNSATQGQ